MKKTKERFSKHLIDIIYPTKKVEEKELWDISGILKNHSNQHLKFDIRPMVKLNSGESVKGGKLSSKADKMVFEYSDQWVIIDMHELIKYIQKNKIFKVHIEDLISKLDWNIILPK